LNLKLIGDIISVKNSFRQIEDMLFMPFAKWFENLKAVQIFLLPRIENNKQ